MTSLVSYLLTLEQQEATGLLNTRTRGNRFVFLPLARLLLLSAQLRIYQIRIVLCSVLLWTYDPLVINQHLQLSLWVGNLERLALQKGKRVFELCQRRGFTKPTVLLTFVFRNSLDSQLFSGGFGREIARSVTIKISRCSVHQSKEKVHQIDRLDNEGFYSPYLEQDH